MRLVLYLIFGLSGAAGLIYESIWARYLSLFVGHSAYAQVLVLIIFLGGMALGAILVARWTTRLSDPLLWYAAAELLLAVIALAFHEIHGVVTEFAYTAVFPRVAGTPLLAVAKWGTAGALILPQSVLLGTTFPLMVAGMLRRFAVPPGKPIALLYFTNSLGAAVGVLVAGFWLLSTAGLPGTLVAASIINLVVATTAYIVARRCVAAADTRHVATAGIALREEHPPRDRLVSSLLIVSFGTAAASFIYEIAWLRMLALVLGAATHTFELMLSAFILGLALGALWVSRRADRWSRPLRLLGVVQWVMGFAALATLPLYIASFQWTADLLTVFARTDAGYDAFNVARYGIGLAVMLPSTFCAGITLPLITRILLGAGAGERAIGAVYGVNTLGSIVGVMLAALVLLPVLGVKALLLIGAAVDMMLGVWILSIAVRGRVLLRPMVWAAGGATIAVVATMTLTTRFDPSLLASGVYRTGRLFAPGAVRVASYRDGRTASIALLENTATGVRILTTNGKGDASLGPRWFEPCTESTVRQPLTSDAATQIAAPLITLAHRPDARTAAVIGHGSGMSSHVLLTSPTLTSLVTVEIEPEVVRASRAFYPANRRVFDDPRSQIVYDDAKSFFAASQQRFDVIFSEPSNPWVSGVAGLFTIEFYERIARYLTDEGVFGQWLHVYEIDDGMVLSILAGLHAHFRDYEVFFTDVGDMVIVATNAATLRRPDWSVFSTAAIAADLCHTRAVDPEDLEAARVTHRAALTPLMVRVAPNSDFYPVVDLRAERARYLRSTARGFAELAAARFDPTAPFFSRRRGPSDRLRLGLLALPRVRALALGAALRSGIAANDSGTVPASFQPALLRRQQWDALLTLGAPPPSWAAWLDVMRSVERDLAGGTAGWIDAGFYRRVGRYLDANAAPRVVRDAAEFSATVARWDFARASVLADSLFLPIQRGESWISVDDYLDGAIVAKLMLGDAVGAARLEKALGAQRRDASGLRARLLQAYIAQALGPRP